MDLSFYDIIKGPVITEKAYKLNKTLQKLVLAVHPKANKPLIAEALEKLFDVKTKSVRIVVRKPKNRRAGRKIIKGVLKKTAIVTLQKGYSVDILNQVNLITQQKPAQSSAE